MSAARGALPQRRPQRASAGQWGAGSKFASQDWPGGLGVQQNYVDDEQMYANGQLPQNRVDLNKLKVQTLRKYSKQYEVAGVHPTSSKEDIAKAVSDHWNSVQITEEAVLQNLLKVRGRH